MLRGLLLQTTIFKNMSLNNVTPGKNIPETFNVVIEIPMNSDPIKYEVDKESGAIFVDRFMTTAMHYPTNYGYVPQTLSGDGDPVDVLVITPYPLHPGVVVPCRPLGSRPDSLPAWRSPPPRPSSRGSRIGRRWCRASAS